MPLLGRVHSLMVARLRFREWCDTRKELIEVSDNRPAPAGMSGGLEREDNFGEPRPVKVPSIERHENLLAIELLVNGVRSFHFSFDFGSRGRMV